MEHEEVCTICADPIATDETDRPRVTIECGHVFHAACIVRWYELGARSCPNCRHETRSHALRYRLGAARRRAAPPEDRAGGAATPRRGGRYVRTTARGGTTRREHDHANRDALRRHKQLRSAAHCARRRHWSCGARSRRCASRRAAGARGRGRHEHVGRVHPWCRDWRPRTTMDRVAEAARARDHDAPALAAWTSRTRVVRRAPRAPSA